MRDMLEVTKNMPDTEAGKQRKASVLERLFPKFHATVDSTLENFRLLGSQSHEILVQAVNVDSITSLAATHFKDALDSVHVDQFLQ